MNSFSPSEQSILRSLEAAIRAPRSAAILKAAAEEIQGELAANSMAQMAWRSIPLDIYDRLPDGIGSSWVFVLRAGCTTGAERHPNSIQRMFTYAGNGNMQIWDAKAWVSHPLTSKREAAMEQRWISIPISVWHRPVMGEGDWVVVSFHTAPAEKLIEERPANDEHPDAGPVYSELYQGRKAR